MNKTEIVFENDEIFVINKSAGVSVQGGEGVSHPLDEEFSKQVGFKVFLVHRLDKETSGLMIVAKNAAAAAKWIPLIAGKSVTKEYHALCFGKPSVNGKTCKKGTLTDSVTKSGRELSAVTHFEVAETKTAEITRSDGKKDEIELSLVHLTLGTGRTHQIRIHLAKAGSPVVGDDRHGDFRLNKAARKIGLKKLCLCATRLTLPLGGEKRVFEIPLPPHFSFGPEQ